jgi:hypothetical protein
MSDETLKPCPCIELGHLTPLTNRIADACDACPHRKPISLEALAKRVEQDMRLCPDDYKRARSLILEFEKELNR